MNFSLQRKIFVGTLNVLPRGYFRVLLSALILWAPSAFSAPKNVLGDFGFGVNNIGSGQAPSLSMDWQSSEGGGFEMLVGVQSVRSSNELRLGIRSTRNLFVEDHQDFYLFAGLGFLSRSSGNGYTLEGGAGSRVFFTEFPNLGLSFGGGFNLESASGMTLSSKVFFGVHYYF
jgi:hypothetical protein